MPTINQSHMTLRTKSPDEKSSLLVDINHCHLFAESCMKTQMSHNILNFQCQKIMFECIQDDTIKTFVNDESELKVSFKSCSICGSISLIGIY